MRHIFIVGSHESRCGKQIFSKLHILSFSEHISDNVNLHCFHSIKIEKNQHFLPKNLFSPQMDTIKKLYISQYWADLLHIFELNSFEGFCPCIRKWITLIKKKVTPLFLGRGNYFGGPNWKILVRKRNNLMSVTKIWIFLVRKKKQFDVFY